MENPIAIPIPNLFTIDVEEWFQIHAFSDLIQPKDWIHYESHIEKNTHHLLDLLESAGNPSNNFLSSHEQSRSIKGTFFILGWVAEHYPNLVKEIYARGHEIASHGYAHKCIFNQTRSEFREDIRKSKRLLEDLIGVEVIGYRAPTFSIIDQTLWAIPILSEEGYQYDSSVFPIHHDYYGMPDSPRFPFMWSFDGSSSSKASLALVEFPMSTIKISKRNWPVTGGGYFRLYPYLLSKYFMKKVNREQKPFIFYLHPWEVDPSIPRLNEAQRLSRFRTYMNLERTEERLKRLLSDFSFSPMRDILEKIKQDSFQKMLFIN